MSGSQRLSHRASRGIAVTVGGLWTKTLIQMASTVVLARILAPSDFGLLAMITALVGVADLVRDFGLTGAIIQAKEMNERLWRSVLWLSVALGVVLSILVAAAAPLVAMLYDEPRLVLLTLVIAPSLLINALCMPLQARITRDLGFSTLARIDVLSMLAGVVASIASALFLAPAGLGVWALIVLQGVGQATRLVLLWVAEPPKFGRPRISREVIPLVTTGGSIFGAEFLGYVEKNADNVIIGHQLGPDVLGQYSRAYALFLLPLQQLNGPIGRVALPVLSQLRDDGDRYRRYIRAAVLVIGYLTIPTYAIAAAVAAPLVSLLLGAGWQDAALIFSLLGIAGVAQSLGKVRNWIYITMARSHRQFVYDLITRPLVVLSFFVGIWLGGVVGLTIAYGVTTLVLLVPGFGFAIRGTFITVRDVVAPVLRPTVLAAFAFAAAFAVTRLIVLPDILELLIGGVAGLVPFAIAMALPWYRADARQIMDFVKKMRKPKGDRPVDEPGDPHSAQPAVTPDASHGSTR